MYVLILIFNYMKKKKLLCGTLLVTTMIGMVSCSNSGDYDALSREDFSENVFQKDSSQIVRFDFSSLTQNEKEELNAFRDFSKAMVSRDFATNNMFKTRAVTECYNIDTSDMDQSSPLVKIINAMDDPEVVSALQNNDVKKYVSLLEEKGALPNQVGIYSDQESAELNDQSQMSLFFIVGAVVAVVAVAYAAVISDVIVLGPSMADNGNDVIQAVENGDILSLDLQKIGDDKTVNEKIDDTILKSLASRGESLSNIETIQNIAKATYYEYK